MFERLLLSGFSVVDLTTSNANVFYELGVRHANRPWSTLLIRKEDSRLPFNVQDLRTVSYTLSPDGEPTNAGEARAAIVEMLRESKQRSIVDSPLFEFFPSYPEVEPDSADTFQDTMEEIQREKEEISDARNQGLKALRKHHDKLRPISNLGGEIAITLFLAYRALEAWEDMITLVEDEEMPAATLDSVFVREQYAMALNRRERHDKAEEVLENLIEEHGPSGETYGHLGRVYKDLWEKAWRASNSYEAEAHLDRSIQAYRAGFEADLNDIYPGINAATLMKIRDPSDQEADQILDVVEYLSERETEERPSSYWPRATLLEVSVIRNEEAKARSNLGSSLVRAEESWQPETTRRNLELLRDVRSERGQPSDWMNVLITKLDEKRQELRRQSSSS